MVIPELIWQPLTERLKMEIYYRHKDRKIVNENANELSFKEAKTAIDQGYATDWNMAFSHLLGLGGDMDKYQRHIDAEIANR